MPAGSYTHVQECICGKMGLGNTIFFSKLVEGSKVRDDISVRILLVTSDQKLHENWRKEKEGFIGLHTSKFQW